MYGTLPSWVLVQDGSREPFDAERISQALFAATEDVRQPDAFLARELTDGVLHFLSQETDGDTIASEALAETVAKIVRELGQPVLAKIFEQRQGRTTILPTMQAKLTIFAEPSDGPNLLKHRFWEAVSIQNVYGRDLESAQKQGLLTLAGLAYPGLLEAVPADVRGLDGNPWAIVAEARKQSGEALILSGLEWAWAGANEREIRAWLSQLDQGLAALDRRAEVLLGIAPAWSKSLGSGPLFGSAEVLEPLADEALQRLLEGLPRVVVRVDSKHSAPRLGRSTIHLAGMLLQTAAEQVERFLEKLPSLISLGVSAGARKRKYLRRHAEHLARGFQLDRAEWTIGVTGLDASVRTFLHQGVADSRASREFGQRVEKVLRDALEREARQTGLVLKLNLADAIV